MERKPEASAAIQGFRNSHYRSKAPEWRIHDRYDRQVSAVTARVQVNPSVLGIVKAFVALVFFDLLRAYGISRSRRTDYGRLAE